MGVHAPFESSMLFLTLIFAADCGVVADEGLCVEGVYIISVVHLL